MKMVADVLASISVLGLDLGFLTAAMNGVTGSTWGFIIVFNALAFWGIWS
jgi:hypothetical protein